MDWDGLEMRYGLETRKTSKRLYNELRFDVETDLAVQKSFVFRLLISKHHAWAIKPKRCHWMIDSLYQKYIVFTVHKFA